jgi:hypothetical protein
MSHFHRLPDGNHSVKAFLRDFFKFRTKNLAKRFDCGFGRIGNGQEVRIQAFFGNEADSDWTFRVQSVVVRLRLAVANGSNRK